MDYSGHVPGLRTSSASLSGFLYSTPVVGNAGLVSLGGGAGATQYLTHLHGWEFTIEPINVHDWTHFDQTDLNPNATGTPTTTFHRPDKALRWFGSYEAYVDNSTDLEPPLAVAGVQAATLTLVANTAAASDDQFQGAGFVEGLAGTARRGDLQTATYAFRGSNVLSAIGTNNPFLTAGGTHAFTTPIWHEGAALPNAATELTLTAISGKTYLMDVFWRRIRVACRVGSLVTIDVDLQINGNIRGTGITATS